VFSLHRMKEDCLLLVDQAEAEHTVQGIEKFHIVENFRIADQTADWAVFSLQGPQSLAVLQQATDQPDAIAAMREYDMQQGQYFGHSAQLIKRSLSGESGYLLLIPGGQA